MQKKTLYYIGMENNTFLSVLFQAFLIFFDALI